MKCTILIAEDEAFLRQLLVSELRERGWTVVEAPDGVQAVEALTDRKPEVVLLDLSMPRKTGIDVLRHIHKHHPSVETIILTNGDEVGQKEECLALGAREYLVKSNFEWEDLIRCVETYLQSVKQVVSL